MHFQDQRKINNIEMKRRMCQPWQRIITAIGIVWDLKIDDKLSILYRRQCAYSFQKYTQVVFTTLYNLQELWEPPTEFDT
jgi:hypothetical protein